MAEAVVSGILGKFGQCLFDLIRSEFDYLFCFDTNIQKLQTQLRDLKATRQGVQLRVVEARNNLRSVPEADTWLIKANNKIAEADRIIEANNKIAEEADRIIEANNKIAEADTIIESEDRVQTGCLNGWCGPRCSLGRKAAKMTQDLVDLHNEGIEYTQLSHSPPRPSIQSLRSTGFKGFESRNLIVKQIIEALKDDEINLVGVCGMVGVGKTTMVEHVAKQVEEEKLFNEVAMAVVSQKPNLKQVQSCIAEMLGLKLDMENKIVRSSRLRYRLLQNDKKILVILDDIWEEFDLEDWGFPLGGGSNKSCKILFTSRNRILWKGIPNKRYIQLQVLVGEEPWHLFREKVGDCADNFDLLPLAKQIVNECRGLPLAVVTVGRCQNSSLKIPSNFFEGMGELKVLDMTITKDISLLPSSLQFLSNLLTLHLDRCQKFDNISVIGKLFNLEILSFRRSDIEELPEEIGGLVNLKLLNLTDCYELKRIAPGIISSLVQLQELYMGGCEITWEREGKEGGENASLSRDHCGSFGAEHISSVGNLLILRGRCTIPSECINSLLRIEGLQHLKGLVIDHGVDHCATPECFVNTMKWVPRTPNAIPPIFPILEKLELRSLPNLRKICHCQLPTGSFGKLKHLEIYYCDGMEEVIWKEKGEDDATNKMEFPALETMTLFDLPMLIDFCSGTGEIEFPQLKKLSLGGLPKLIGFCSGTGEIEFPQLKELRLQQLPQLKWLFLNSSNPFSESMENHNATFISLFPHKVALPSLEELVLLFLDNLEGLGHIPISVGSFSKLRKVHVEQCGKLLCVFPSQFLTRLRNLEDLTVENCTLLEKVFESEIVDDKEQESEMLLLLKSLHVHDCDNLRYLFPYSMMKCMLQLQELDIRRCKLMSRILADEKGHGKSSVDKIEFTQLKILRLYDLPNLVFFPKVIATSATSTERLQNVMQTLFNEKVK
ncbi:putative disease resistance protein [Camellia lanceoleosa]|uniref:Disease resistance protein n=1 Tax=Camellia lanceoleosa TaxID=1840588 RepID=A0ACC0FUX7_9ERIC|nr:putative disease resistance protein [Camellia lanceoleosa]